MGRRNKKVPVPPSDHISWELRDWELREQLGNYDCSLGQSLTWPSLRNNLAYVITVGLLVTSNAAIFVHAALTGEFFSSAELVAGGCGRCLSLDCAILPLFVSRHVTSWLKSTSAIGYLPVDRGEALHTLTGYVVCVLSITHVAAHIINYMMKSEERGGSSLTKHLFSANLGTGWVVGTASITGFICLGCLIIVVVSSSDCFRNAKHFMVFYVMHLFYLPFWISLILHAADFWKWFLLPLCVWFTAEKLTPSRHVLCPSGSRDCRGGHYMRSCIVRASLLQSGVVLLVIRCPSNLSFRPGDYVFLNVPQVAWAEWRPFTITSPPEQDDVLTVHVLPRRRWTNPLKDTLLEDVWHVDGSKLESGPIRFRRRLYHSRYAALDSRRVSVCFDVMSLSDDDITEGRRDAVTAVLAQVRKEPMRSTLFGVVRMRPPRRRLTPSKKSKPVRSSRKNNLHKNYPGDGNGSSSTDILSDEEESLKKADTLVEAAAKNRDKGNMCVMDADAKIAACGEDENRFSSTSNPFTSSQSMSVVARVPTSDLFVVAMPPRSMKMPKNATVKKNENFSLPRLGLESQVSRAGLADHVGSFDIDVHKEIKVWIDGPYSTPSSDIFSTRHAVIIVADVEVTPYASILQSIMIRYRSTAAPCPSCGHQFYVHLPPSYFSLQSVDFVWLVRDIHRSEWFLELLEDLENSGDDNGTTVDDFLNLHLFQTGRRPLPTSIALRTRIRKGRPRWNKLFREIQKARRAQPAAFFCGPPALAGVLRGVCRRFNMPFTKETF